MIHRLISGTGGLAGAPMQTDWKGIHTLQAFAAAARHIAQTKTGHEAHRQMDRLTNEVLCNLGFGEGAEIFAKAAFDWHHPQLVYPHRLGGRFWCRLGFHHWEFDRESPAPWPSPELCIYCNERRCASLHEICP